MTIPRVMWNMLSGVVRRSVNKPAPGCLMDRPSIWKTRIGFIDTDLNVHLNNASYLTQMELAIWYAVAHTGILHRVLAKRWYFLIGSQAIRYRHQIPPLRPIEVHTQTIYWDDTWVYLQARFVCPASGKLYAEGLSRITLRHGRDTVHPHNMFDVVFDVKAGEKEYPQPQMPDVIRDYLAWDASSAISMKEFSLEPTPKLPITSSFNLPWEKL
ncbi:hypothetical protein ACHHYP_16610 [Achlya hypogyna]|uniref:Thioesterase n=1 Tax=Achlya hypogyna TaxID=1202772 RepID=A0A1V9Y6B2_ACHHY|nr:hypothetical protein ACHHYP_16610 [Achlya hypogyna]